MDFAGRNVVLTGVGREGQVGEAVAHAFAAAGAHVLLVDRKEDAARARASDIAARGMKASGFGADLANPESVAALALAIRSVADTVHAVVHLAGGFAMSGPLAESDPEVWSRQLSINATTAYLTARAFIPMLRQSRGALVFFASEAVLPGGRTANVSAYAAAKGVVVSLVHAIAQEEGSRGIRVNAVAPTSIRTASNLADMGQDVAYVSREEVARVVLWLASDEARVINGQVIRVR